MFSNITILYVEDEIAIQDAMLNILPQLFKEIIVASDGVEGLELFNKNIDKIDLIVTDINMPRMGGLEMLDKIKEISPFIPMCITTAHNDTSFLHRAIEVGVTGYVNKPINVSKLFEIIKKNILPIIEKKKLEIQLENQRNRELQSAKFSAIGQLSAGIIHEINTPLTFIKGTFEIMQYDINDLEDSELKSTILNDSKVIINGIRRIENIISSMKEMACSSDDLKEDVNIYSSIVTSLIMTYNKSKHISKIYINGEKFEINHDKINLDFITNVQKQRIEQVWIVIVNNAMDELLKRDDFETNKLDINIQSKDGKIIIKFKDNAGGIDESIKDTIFEAFKSTKDSSGMGVGLNIAQKIILENNGIIEAYNEDDGAVFKVIL